MLLKSKLNLKRTLRCLPFRGYLIYGIFIVLLLLGCSGSVYQSGDNNNIPDEKAKIPSNCSTKPFPQSSELHKLYTSNHALFVKTFTKLLSTYSNVGYEYINFPNGGKIVFRSATFGPNPDGLKSLVKNAHITTIINLFSAKWVYNLDELNLKEKNAFMSVGGQNYIQILHFSDNPAKYPNREVFLNKISQIIKYIQYSDGNVLIHCLGGEHRTGIIFGILLRCFNDLSMEKVIDNYKLHVSKGLFKEQNIETIKRFHRYFIKLQQK